MSKLDSWIDNKIAQNLFVWFLLFLILLTTIQSDNRVASAFYAILLLAPAVYVNNLFVLSYLKKKRVAFMMLFLLNAVVFTAVSVFFIKNALGETFRWELFLNFFGIMVLALVFASTIKLAKDSFTRRQQEKEAELKLLKAQLNPHFLFNTLNNLYGLSVVKSDKLPSLMLKLSDLLRYSLYETKEMLVPLEKEIQYLENYMSLEKIRLEDTTEITCTQEGGIDGLEIAPMLLIVFVENAFKHLSVSEEKKSRVAVSVVVKNEQLVFSCVNTYDPAQYNENTLEKGSGIGLTNAIKRLDLIYPEKHQLKQTVNQDNTYSVSLTVSLHT